MDHLGTETCDRGHDHGSYRIVQGSEHYYCIISSAAVERNEGHKQQLAGKIIKS